MSARAKVLMDTRSASLMPLVRPGLLPVDATPVDKLARQYTALVAATRLRDRMEAEGYGAYLDQVEEAAR